MKNFFKQSAVLTLAMILTIFALVAISYTPATTAAPRTIQSLPTYWGDDTGSNSFGLNSSAAPVVISAGVVYTGVTTNLAVKSGSGPTNIIYIVNGVVTSIGIQ
jgi:hypothetical protein